MSTDYDYSFATDFSSQVDLEQLEALVAADAGIPTSLDHVFVNVNADLVRFTFPTPLSAPSETDALDALVAAYTYDPPLTIASGSAVVALDGTGLFTSVAEAFNAGFKDVIVGPGTFLETATVQVPAGGSLKGRSPDETILDFSTAPVGTSGVVLDGSVGGTLVPYTTGTLTFTQGSATVTGAGGTLFLANVQSGWFVVVDDATYEIQSVDSDTQLTLASLFRGQSASGVSTRIQPLLEHAFVSNLAIVAAPNNQLHLRSAREAVVEDVRVLDAVGFGVHIQDCVEVTLTRVHVVDAINNALVVDRSVRTEVVACTVTNATADGIHILNASTYTTLRNVTTAGNGGSGMVVTGNSLHTRAHALVSQDNGTHGVQVTAGSTDTCFVQATVFRNGSKGFELGGLRGSLLQSSVYSNGDVGVDCAAAQQAIAHSTIRDNTNHNVELNATEAAVVDNRITGSVVGSGIRVVAGLGTRSRIQANVIASNFDYGVDIPVSEGIVIGNQMNGHSTSLKDITSVVTNIVVGNSLLSPL